jgi:hypothetical protein
MEEEKDRLVNIDFAGRGIEHRYGAARAKIGRPLFHAAAEDLAAAPRCRRRAGAPTGDAPDVAMAGLSRDGD